MTSEKLSQAISAVKTINEINNTIVNTDNITYCKRIQSNLETLTDFLQDVFIDMVKADGVKLDQGLGLYRQKGKIYIVSYLFFCLNIYFIS